MAQQIENFLTMFAGTFGRSFAMRPPSIGTASFDAAVEAIVGIGRDFETTAATHRYAKKTERLGAVGLREALNAAALEAGVRMAVQESSVGVVGDLKVKQAALRERLMAPPAPSHSRTATVDDLRVALAAATRQQLLYPRLAQLSAAERKLMFANTADPDVIEILQHGPPIIRVKNGVAFTEPLLDASELEAAALGRARLANPGDAQRLDEITEQIDAIEALLAQARDKIGEAVREPGDPRSGRNIVTGGSSVKVHGADGIVDADALPAQAQPVSGNVGEPRPMIVHGPEGEDEA